MLGGGWVLLVCGVDLDVLCRFVFVGWVFNGGVSCVWACCGWVVVIICFVRGGWFVLIGLICWCVLGCRLECSCRSGSCCLMVGCGLVL